MTQTSSTGLGPGRTPKRERHEDQGLLNPDDAAPMAGFDLQLRGVKQAPDCGDLFSADRSATDGAI